MKKYIVGILIVLTMLASGTYYYFSGKDYLVIISDSQIRETINAKMPLQKTYFFIFDVTLSNPRVVLEEASDRVNAGLDVDLNIKIDNNPNPLGGEVDISGAVTYNAGKGEFFLIEPKIEHLDFQGLNEKYRDKAISATTVALTAYFENNPIYTLKKSELKQATARMILKKVEVKNKALMVTLGI